ncbi:MAG TPA: hypothetical protein ENI64_05240 [Gammaproteobacteria bacterium]|nr:hypothetical protein [Gammaproteobacteria bacterium]
MTTHAGAGYFRARSGCRGRACGGCPTNRYLTHRLNACEHRFFTQLVTLDLGCILCNRLCYNENSYSKHYQSQNK